MTTTMLRVAVLGITLFSLAGCGSLRPDSSRSIRLNEILSPVKDSLVAEEKKPLIFPTMVTILMIPGNRSEMVPESTLRIAAETLKKELLKNDKYVNGVSIISSDDTREKITLDTIRNLYGSDIVIVVSYQQDQRKTQNTVGALLDIAIAPIFLVPSVKMTTSTVIDGKIIHIPSNAIIFRSSGIDETISRRTRYSVESSQATEESIQSFIAATSQLGMNISKKLEQLNAFDIKNAVSVNTFITESETASRPTTLPATASRTVTPSEPTEPIDNWKKVDNYKRSGGGAFGWLEISILGLLALCSRNKKYFNRG
ncbi:MAG TPA: rhombotarget lipoprotein [Moraxellaceae bacterium]|nr:rhombotarget lipoprotein [Moraxellaceae bacterium]